MFYIYITLFEYHMITFSYGSKLLEIDFSSDIVALKNETLLEETSHSCLSSIVIVRADKHTVRIQ